MKRNTTIVVIDDNGIRTIEIDEHYGIKFLEGEAYFTEIDGPSYMIPMDTVIRIIPAQHFEKEAVIENTAEAIRMYEGYYCNLLNEIPMFYEEACYVAERLEDILDSDEYIEAKANPEQNEILIQMLNAE